jgi:dihydrofolate reductase
VLTRSGQNRVLSRPSNRGRVTVLSSEIAGKLLQRARARQWREPGERMRNLILFMHMSLDGYIAALGTDRSGRDRTITSPCETLPWSDSELLLVKSDEDMIHAVARLKHQPGKNIVSYCGVRTAQELARLNLIDEYQLVVPPVALGEGQPLFKNLPGRLKLTLLEVVELTAGGVFLRYEPAWH